MGDQDGVMVIRSAIHLLDGCALSMLAWSMSLVPQAPAVIVIPDRSSCDCRIILDSVATLVDTSGVHAFNDYIGLSRDRRGRFYAISGLDPARIAVFDSTGEHLRTFGRQGSGPGEFRRALPPAFTRGDTLHIADYGSGRYNVIDPEYRWVRSSRLPARVTNLDMIAGDTAILTGVIPTRERAGYPLHRWIISSNQLDSFGSETGAFRVDRPHDLRRISYIANDGSIWIAHANQYVIERWLPGGRRTARIHRATNWFPHWRAQPDISRIPPFPVVSNAWVEGQYLWIVINIAGDARTAVGRSVTRGQEQMTFLSGADRELIWDSRVEVIDLTTNTLLAFVRVPHFLFQVKGGGFAYSYREQLGGTPGFVIWKPRLEFAPEP